ncbi:methionine ABC transporter permease [Streptacidiphilus jiangxiensis]|uniref:D-methionine transport system permease protein n=1 Tax=Streptacidiphilus jiangxiensis TaxID=235985 RepID=A0A1H7XGT2_STRJI|nr:methionine ABC transporter permease [Streptacidiphilus jiangxiensis]SEM32970.1 D-methionine transport system permease protein [Streptacidiphilus jiangxiensis]
MGWNDMQPLLVQATQETLWMVGLATLATVLVGLPLGLLLALTRRDGLLQNAPVNKAVGTVVNVGRSLPFVILIVAIIPFTRWVVGTTLGWQAATVPLAIGAIPFFARLVETAVADVDGGLVEAVQAMGGSTWTVVRRVLLPEALPALVSSLTTTVIALIGYSAMAGTVGGGGLGTLAINYGYMRFETTFMWVIAAELVVLVTLVQLVGEGLARSLDHKRPATRRTFRRRVTPQISAAPKAAETPAREPELTGSTRV